MKPEYFIISFLLISVSASAQLAIGIQGGPNFASVQFRDRPDFLFRDIKLLESYQFGGVIRYASEKSVAMQLEFNYSKKGWRDVDPEDVQTTRVINYYEFPFLTQFNIGGKKVKIIIEGGPYLGYAKSSEIEVKDRETGEGEKSEYEFVDGIDNRWDYGLMARVGMQFRFSWGALEGKAFYSYGYGNLYLDKSEALELSQNRVYGAVFSYLFFFGKQKESGKE